MIVTSAPLSKFYVNEQIKTIFIYTGDDIDKSFIKWVQIEENTAKLAIELGTYSVTFVAGSVLSLDEL
jgi:hypothetical protein